MIGFAADNYSKKQFSTSENQIMQIIEFHADPQNFLILTCEKGLI